MEDELIKIIQDAWNEGERNPKDKFGEFLRRAAKAIIRAGYKKSK